MAERSKALESGYEAIQSERAGVRISLMSFLFLQGVVFTRRVNRVQSKLDLNLQYD